MFYTQQTEYKDIVLKPTDKCRDVMIRWVKKTHFFMYLKKKVIKRRKQYVNIIVQ